jgi:hypothetical protein
MSKVIDLVGRRFGRLLVLRLEGIKEHKAYWQCKCDCGNFTTAFGNNLKRGTTKSCGCIQKENASNRLKEKDFGDVAIDMAGKRFGRLTVIKRAGLSKDRKATWLCQCECGNTKIVSGKDLRTGKTRSCGCQSMRSLYRDLTGERFGRLLVLMRVENSKNKKSQWLCKCDCGKEVKITVDKLNSGVTRSCGCLHNELLMERSRTHGLSHTRLFSIWCGMKSRCYNSHQPRYNDYGGRGIIICDEWFNDFKAFYDWGMANGYQDNLSIDRINNDKGYSPDNCRWADSDEQQRNKRSNIVIEHNGENRTLAEWCRIYGVNRTTAKTRLKSGKTFEEIFNIKN